MSGYIRIRVLLVICWTTCVSGQVSLSLGSTPLADNSEVVITDIGDEATGGSPLICTTIFRPCCTPPHNRLGDWYYPNGTMVPTSSAGGNFYRNRGDDGTVRLHRRNVALTPLGTYYCEIPLSSANVFQRMTVRVVSTLPPTTPAFPPSMEPTTPDINECTSGADDCVSGATCVNTDGSFACRCRRGYTGDARATGTGCEDFDECAAGVVSCSSGRMCINTPGSFSCVDINECTSGADDCVSGATCVNNFRSFTCTCPSGFHGDGRTSGTGCTDNNECTSNTVPDDCVSGATCMNTEGSFTCTCPSGLTGDGRTSGTGCTVQVEVIFQGVSLPNNSVLSINDVGEYRNGGAVLCTTDRSPCCGTLPNRFGLWYYPDGTLVPNSLAPDDFYRGRENNGTIHLSRRNNAQSPTGSFCCELPDSRDVNHTLCVTLVLQAPSSPTIVSTTPQSTSITITWSQPEEDVVDSYEIISSYQGPCPGVGRSSMIATVFDGTMRDYTVSDLHEFGVYMVTVIAVNSAGIGYAITSAATLATAPSGPPQSLTVTSTTPFTISIQWGEVECLEQNSVITGYSVRYGGVTASLTGASNRTFTANGLTPRTSYTFEVAAVSDSGTGPFEKNFTASETSIFDSVGLLLNDQLYPNNSIVDLDEIGEDSAALLCLTNKTDCCSSEESKYVHIGDWHFPDGRTVQTFSNRGSDGYYRDRGPSVVRLHREMSGQTTGLFRCEVDDVSDEEVELTVGVYRQGEGVPNVTNLVYDRDSFRLTCTSTGGPATTVTWRRNGELFDIDGTTYEQEERVTSYMTATYEITLDISSPDISTYVSTFSCTVANSRGTSSRSLTLEGVEVGEGQLTVGDNAAITCTSVISATMEWLDSEGRVVSNVNSQRQLDLMFNPVNDSIHNTQYTCRVTQGGVVGRTVDISVTVPERAVSANVRTSGRATVGEIYTLTCIAYTRPGLVNTPTATWRYSNGRVIQAAPSTSVITFDPLRTSNAGQYICRGSVVSPALQEPLVEKYPTYVSFHVQIPTPNVTITVPSGPLYAGTTSFTLTCTITLSEYVNTDVMMDVPWSRSGTPLSNTTSRVAISPLAKSGTTYTSYLTLSPLYPEDNATYECTAIGHPSPPTYYVRSSGVSTTTVDVVLQIQLIFRGVSLSNNSVLSINDVREFFNGGAVFCTTDRRPCCASTPNRLGRWLYPNGTEVPNPATGYDFYRLRLDNQTIHLNRRNKARSPTGSFCCELPDSSDVTQRACVTLVDVSLTPSGTRTTCGQYQLDCTVTGSTVTPTFTWLGPPSNTPLPSDTRMVSSGSTYTSILQFGPIQSSHEGMYTCQVTVGTVTEMRSTQVDVEEPVITAMVNASGTPTVGHSYSLTCTVTGADRLNPTITYQWFKENTVVLGETQSTLSFSSLSLFDAGQYRCNATVSSTCITQDITEMSNTQDLTLQIPPPTAVTVTASPDGTIFTGSSLTLTCTIELSEAVGIAVTVNTVWSGPSGTQFTTTTSVATRMTDTTYTSTATLSSVRWIQDSGEFKCRVTVSSTSPFVTSSTAVGATGVRDVLRKFQLKLGRTDDCITWNPNKAKEVRSYILEELLLSLASRCQCDLPRENLLNGVFSCQSSHNQTTYRSTIVGTQSHNATELVGLIQDWVTSAPTITIQWYTARVDPKCPVSISSLGDPECRKN